MTINASIQTTRPTISSIVANLRSKGYFVDNSFQRRLVWTERQKVRLIETVLLGYPMPEIYLWQLEADANTGDQRHSVVDGQQRLTSLQQFVSNEWPLKAHYLDNKNSDYVGKFWKDLDDDSKKSIWDYVISARIIPSNLNEQNIRDIFTRLNETDKSLNPQELRNAQFNGEFIEAAVELAGLSCWKDWAIFSDNQIRRMNDIELMSSLLIYQRVGVTGDTASSINKTYDLYNDNYEQRENDIKSVKRFIATCKKTYFTDPKVRKFFTTTVHFYSLYVIDDLFRRQKLSRTAAAIALPKFVSRYSAGNASKQIENYREASSYRTRSKGSRQVRVDNLSQWLIENM
jgi:Protein of unknown function DUF262